MPFTSIRVLLVVFGVAVLSLLSVGGMIAWSGMRADVDAMNQQSLPALLAVSDINANYKDVRAQVLTMALERDQSVRDDLAQRLAQRIDGLSAAVSGLRGLGLDSTSLEEVTQAFFSAVNAASKRALAGQRDDAVALVYSAVVPAEQNMSAYVEGTREALMLRRLALEKRIQTGGVTLLVYCLLGISLGLLLRWIILPSVSALMPAADEALVSREVAETMHAHAGNMIMASLVGSAILVTVFLEHPERLFLYGWWAVLLGVLAARLIGYLSWYRTRGFKSRARRAIQNFGAGSLASALVWAAFPFLFFVQATALQRMVMAFVFAAIAGAGSVVLAPARRVSLLYMGILLLPPVGFFTWAGSRIDLAAAMLFLGLLASLMYSSGRARQLSLSSLLLSRENKRLADESLKRQEAVEELNASLEARVQERTLMLEREMEAREAYALQLKALALHDPLTGLLNRRALAENTEEVLACAAGVGMGAQILFIDLDRFKEVNDVQGHQVGDRVLMEVAARLKEVLPEPALVARWGGDEFVAVVPALPGRDVVAAIRRRLIEPVYIDERVVRIDVSIGISLSPEQGRDVEVLVRQADVAMYQAKLHGRSGAEIYEPMMGEQLRRMHELGQALREALAGNALEILFQPIVPLTGSLPVKMEALLRWQHPVQGEISPREFISIAENAGLIGRLGRWVLAQACAEAQQNWPGNTVVSVNVSALQLMSGELLDDVSAVLAETGLAAHRLELELTESVFVHDMEKISQVLNALRARDVRIAIDDFGTGYSSLSYLRRLPVDTIKIDRSFVLAAKIEGDQMLRAICGLARGFSCKVVAEGVEHKAQQSMLREVGVDYIQGELVSVPLSSEAAAQWVNGAYCA